MPEHDPHSSAIKTPKQLIVVVLAAFLVPITAIGLLSQFFTSMPRDTQESPAHVLARIQPVGTVVIAEAGPASGNTASATPAPSTAPSPPASPQPSTTAAASAAPATSTSAPPTSAGATTKTASASSADEGKAVYDQTCHVCHATGLAGSPKFGDKAAWAPRIATGIPTLYNAALHGLNAMPPKGGNASLSDAQVKAAVDYMVAAAK